MNTAPVTPNFYDAMLPAIEAGNVSCANCRHWRIGVDYLDWDLRIPTVRCHQGHHEPRRIDRNIGPSYAEVAERRAFDCGDFDSMTEGKW